METFDPVNILSWEHVVHRNILSTGTCYPQEPFELRSILSWGTFVLGSIFSSKNILSPESFCPHEHIVPRNMLSTGSVVLGTFCSQDICPQDICLQDICISGHFSVQSHFVSGTCCPSTFCLPGLYFVA